MLPKNNEIRFETTNKCNYNCIMCARDKLKRKQETMDLKTFKHLLNKILIEAGQQYKICTFSGFGEPLLDETILEKVRYVRDKNLEVLILTNGYLLNFDLYKRFNRMGVKSIRISIYGNSDSVYFKVHRKYVLSEIKRTLNQIFSLPKRHTEIILTYNIVEGVNDHEIDSWIKTWKDKADLLEVWKPHNWVRAKCYRKIQEERLNTCGRPYFTPLQVQVDGMINMCCFDFNGELIIGNLKAQCLDEIFDSINYRHIRQCHETGDFVGSGLICENCDQRNKNKDGIMVYNSKFDIKDRIYKFSTSYGSIDENH